MHFIHRFHMLILFFVFKFDQWSVIYIHFSCGAYNLFDGTPTVNGLYQKDPPGYPEFQEYILEESTNDGLSSYYKDRAIALTLDNENGTKKMKPVLWYSNQVIIFQIFLWNNCRATYFPLRKSPVQS